jgi:hypothetical protein
MHGRDGLDPVRGGAYRRLACARFLWPVHGPVPLWRACGRCGVPGPVRVPESRLRPGERRGVHQDGGSARSWRAVAQLVILKSQAAGTRRAGVVYAHLPGGTGARSSSLHYLRVGDSLANVRVLCRSQTARCGGRRAAMLASNDARAAAYPTRALPLTALSASARIWACRSWRRAWAPSLQWRGSAAGRVLGAGKVRLASWPLFCRWLLVPWEHKFE